MKIFPVDEQHVQESSNRLEAVLKKASQLAKSSDDFVEVCQHFGIQAEASKSEYGFTGTANGREFATGDDHTNDPHGMWFRRVEVW